MFSRRSVLGGIAGTVAVSGAQAKADEGSLLPLLGEVPLDNRGARLQSADVSISVADSPLKNALDIYYDFLVGICKQNGYKTGTDKMLINNTITSFDISQDTPYYNEGLFRAFAD